MLKYSCSYPKVTLMYGECMVTKHPYDLRKYQKWQKRQKRYLLTIIYCKHRMFIKISSMKTSPFIYNIISGAIGRKIVVKHYKNNIVVTKFPDMTNIKPSLHQHKCRSLFREAVALHVL